MSDQHIKYNEFKKYMHSQSAEQIREGNEIDHSETDRQYHEFVNCFNENKCYICGLPLDIFDPNIACAHWLLAPKGFKKRHFPEIYKRFSYVNLQSYLRWIANQEKIFGNINDLKDEMHSDKIIDNTIQYKNLEWSFSCSKGDYEGHKDKFLGKEPHYHFQMRIGMRPFIDYKDFHIPFNDYDLIVLEMMRDDDAKLKHNFRYGEGMQTALGEINPSELVNLSKPSLDESSASFKFNSIIEAKPGEKMSGYMLNELIQESNETGVSLTSLLHKLGGNVEVYIEPADSVPAIAHRTERLRGKKGKSVE